MNLLEQYRKKLDKNNRVLNLTHNDYDGASCSIVLSNIYKNIEFIPLKYGEVDSKLKTIDFSKYDLILMTDISPETEEVFKLSDKIFLLDHHSTGLKYHSPESNRLCIEGKCAAVLVKEFFENLFKLDLSYLNDFCNIVNDFDMWYMKDVRSWGMNELYFKYYASDFRLRFKSGEIKLKDFEIEYINERKKLLTNVYNNLTIYPCENVNMCFFIENKFINDLCHMTMEKDGFDVSICINTKSNSCSVRSKNKDLHIGKMLQEIPNLNGGGHSSSGAFRIDPNQEISIKIELIEQYLMKNFSGMKKRKFL